MSARSQFATGSLLGWDDIESREDWGALILGNGASIAVWDGFRYRSLYEVACRPILPQALDPQDVAIFEEFNTSNFEETLGAIHTAIRVQRARNIQVGKLELRYESIRGALIAAVRATHVAWDRVSDSGVLKSIADRLAKYREIYSLNYDLLLYWAIMAHPNGTTMFKDFFWKNPFSLVDAEVFGNVSTVLYLHGGLHLARSSVGRTRKRVRQPFANLLDTFAADVDALPLFVSEGTSQEKLRAIGRSDYLTFAYRTLVETRAPAVVFGASLSSSDQHILDALESWGTRPLAISMLNEGRIRNRARMHAIAGKLPRARLLFFDATTHPLGADDLKVT